MRSGTEGPGSPADWRAKEGGPGQGHVCGGAGRHQVAGWWLGQVHRNVHGTAVLCSVATAAERGLTFQAQAAGQRRIGRTPRGWARRGARMPGRGAHLLQVAGSRRILVVAGLAPADGIQQRARLDWRVGLGCVQAAGGGARWGAGRAALAPAAGVLAAAGRRGEEAEMQGGTGSCRPAYWAPF